MAVKATLIFILILAFTSTFAKVSKKELEDEEENESVVGGYDLEDSVKDDDSSEKQERVHPCQNKNCGKGFECDLDEDNNPICICVRKCYSGPKDSRLKVCTSQNVTFESECEFHRMKCLCQHSNAECQQDKYKNAHLDYFGPCKELPPCTEDEMEEFPKRMRSWLFLVMEELDNRNDLNEAAHNMVIKAKSLKHPWVLPVIWKFCELDESHDSFVTSSELIPISAPLKPLEHCTAPFLEKCDADNDGNIILKEWGTCLGLEEDEIEDHCDSLRE